jgi:predicted transglutaminase-like cysteine proteinase
MPVVILDRALWSQLEQVQTQVERQVSYESDMDRFGVPDWWEPASDRGDCEDIVLAKRLRLMNMGWPADALRVAVVIDGHGQLHAVLTVDVKTQAGAPATYVLDSHFAHVEPWSVLNQYGYTWLERSKPGSNQWVRLDRGGQAETWRIASLAAVIMPASPRWVEGRGADAGQGAQEAVQKVNAVMHGAEDRLKAAFSPARALTKPVVASPALLELQPQAPAVGRGLEVQAIAPAMARLSPLAPQGLQLALYEGVQDAAPDAGPEAKDDVAKSDGRRRHGHVRHTRAAAHHAHRAHHHGKHIA